MELAAVKQFKLRILRTTVIYRKCGHIIQLLNHYVLPNSFLSDPIHNRLISKGKLIQKIHTTARKLNIYMFLLQ